MHQPLLMTMKMSNNRPSLTYSLTHRINRYQTRIEPVGEPYREVCLSP